MSHTALLAGLAPFVSTAGSLCPRKQAVRLLLCCYLWHTGWPGCQHKDCSRRDETLLCFPISSLQLHRGVPTSAHPICKQLVLERFPGRLLCWSEQQQCKNSSLLLSRSALPEQGVCQLSKAKKFRMVSRWSGGAEAGRMVWGKQGGTGAQREIQDRGAQACETPEENCFALSCRR